MDGLIMASTLPSGTEDKVAAMSSALMSIGEDNRRTEERQIRKGLSLRIRGFIVLSPLGEDALIAAICSSRAKLGMVFYEISKFSSEGVER